MQLDPEEIFGSAIWEALRRGLAILACLYIGSLLAFVGWLGIETIASLFASGFTSLPSYDFGSTLILLPFWSFGTAFAFLAIPNILAIAIYYFRTEEPTRRRFIIFTTIQQISIAGALIGYQLSAQSSVLLTIVVLAGALYFQVITWGLFIFTVFLVKGRIRHLHEEHLISVAADNALWRQKLEDAEFIPPPPSGPASPKARPLR